MRPRGLGFGALAILAACSALGTATASAATLTVNTIADITASGDGICSLREAIAADNSPGTPSDCGTASASGNTIVLGPRRYALAFPNPALHVLGTAAPLTIAGTRSTTIDASALGDRVLLIDAGASATIENLTLTGGHAPAGSAGTAGAPDSGSGHGGPGGPGGDGANGGGIYNGGSLTLVDATVWNNRAGNGGAGGAGGTSPHGQGGNGGQGGRGGEGGGIYNTGTLQLTGVTISDNQAGAGGDGGAGGQSGDTGGAGGNGGCCGDGGGIANEGGSVEITDSTVVLNSAGASGFGGNGGNGAFNGGAGGDGRRGSRGGGISSQNAPVAISLTNSTVTGNSAGDGGSGGNGGSTTTPSGRGGNGGNGGDGGDGGAIRFYASSSTLSSVTVSANFIGRSGGPGAGGTGATSSGGTGNAGAAGNPGGVFIESPPAATLEDSIVASNVGGNCLSVGDDISDGGHNLTFGDTTCPGTSGDPKLGPLQDNGGPTQTMGLKAGSAAIDQVPASGGGCPQTDQRGVSRPHGAACDIGAFELAGPDITTGAATSITTSGATLNGSVTPNQSSANVHFEYGTTTSYGATTGNQQVGGVGARPVSALLTGLKPNTTYHYRLLGTSPDGSQAGSDRTFTTQSAPSLGHLSIAPASFRTKKHHHRPHKTGTIISYTDSQASTTTFTVWRCKKMKKHRGCVRYSKVGTFHHNDVSGRNRFRWSGRIGARRLKPGRYRLDLAARAGGLTSNTLSARFRIVG